MSSRLATSPQMEETRADMKGSIQNLVDRYHISSQAVVGQRGEAQFFKSLGVWLEL